jgi:hypothetical protein
MSALIAHVRHQVVAYLALFVALCGTSYAAAQLPRNSVGGAQLRHGSVTAAKVAAGSLLARDFKPGQLGTTSGPAGPAGPKGDLGPQGSPGQDGSPGAPGQSGATTVVTRTDDKGTIATGNKAFSDAACRPGERATGGGGTFFGPGANVGDHLVSSLPVHIIRGAGGTPVGSSALTDGQTPDGWEVSAVNAGVPRDFIGYVVCVSP